MLEPEGDQGAEEFDYCTPKPKVVGKKGSKYHADLEEDEDESVFVSPLKARKKPAPVAVALADSDIELTGTDGGFKAKGKGKKTVNSGKRALREMVQEKRTAMTADGNNKQVMTFYSYYF